MALTKVAGDILDPGIVVAGIVTATGFSGPFSNGTTGTFSGDVTVGGNLTVNGDYTTLNTTLREVEILRVDTNSSTAAGIITQTGAGDILNLFDGTTEVFKVADGGQTTIATTGYPQLILKDSDSNSPSDTNGISLRSANNTEYGFIGQTESGGHSLFIKTVATTNPIRLQVNSTTRFEVGNTGGYVTGLLDVTGNVNVGDTLYVPDKIIHKGGDDDTSIRFPAADTIQFETGGTQRVTVNNTTGVNTLDVLGGARADYFVGRSNQSAPTADAAMYRAADNTLAFSTANTERLRISSAGNVGIGTDNPHQKLHISATNPIIKFTDTDVDESSFIRGASGNLYFDTDNTNRDIIFRSGNSSAAEVARITGDGKVGIATPTPATTLDVQGDMAVAYNATHALRFYTQPRNNWSSISNTATDGNANLSFKSSQGEAMFITYSRLVGIGTDDPGYELHVWPDGATSSGQICAQSNGNDTFAELVLKTDGGTGSIWRNSSAKTTYGGANSLNIYQSAAAPIVFFTDGNNERLRITSDGITVTGEVAASQDYPNYRPTLNLNFTAVKKLDPRITYTRIGPASYIDEFGKVVLVGANTPRFDHDPATGESKGLLIEETRINLIPWSFDGGNWSTGSGGNTVTRNAGTAPDGTETATKVLSANNDIDVNTQLGNAGPGLTGQIAISGSTAYTLSIWAKASTTAQVGNNFKVRWKRVQGDSTFAETTFALTADWRRYSTTATTAANNTTVACYIGGVSGSEALIWGAQFEAGAYSTSNISTRGASATRGAETVTIEGEEFSDFYNPVESTIVVNYTHPNGVTSSNLGGVARLYRFRAVGGNDTRIDYVSNSGNEPYIAKDAVAVANINNGQSTVFDGGVNRTAVRVKENSFASSFNGSSAVEDTSGAWNPTNAITEVVLGSQDSSGGNPLNGHIQRFMYYPVGLPNSQLVTLTS